MCESECAGRVQVSSVSGEDCGKVSHPAGRAEEPSHLHPALQTRYQCFTSFFFPLVHSPLHGWFQEHYVLFTETHMFFIVAHHAFIALYSTCLRIQNVCVGILSAGLLKTHNLSFQDSESLQAVFDKDSYANVFRSQPRSVKSFCILCYENNVDLTFFLFQSLPL